jgi:hypothetical protein
MFTLPADTDSLILSKLFVASIWTVLSFVAVMIAVSIMTITNINLKDIFDTIAKLFDSALQAGYSIPLLIIEACVLVIVSLFSSILSLYACMALSMLFNRHRVGFSFLMYMIINIAGQILMGIFFSVANYPSLVNSFSTMPEQAQVQTVIIGMILLTAASCVVFYFITRWMLKNRLNLE